MAKRVSVRLLRGYHGELERTRGGAPEVRRTLSSQIKAHIDAYSRNRRQEHLFSLSDCVERWLFEINRKGAPFADFLVREISHTKPIRAVAARWRRVDLKKLRISREPAKNLFLQAVTGGVARNEFSGGAKLVEKDGHFFIEPAYSHPQRYPLTAPTYCIPFISTGSHLLWHTHPAAKHLSPRDKKFSKISGIPLLLAAQNQIMEIAVNGRAYPVIVDYSKTDKFHDE